MFFNHLKKSNDVIAIVDGYSIGRFFAPKLHELGYKCIHVQSSIKVPTIYTKSFVPEDYVKNIIYNGLNLQSIIDELRTDKTRHIIVGAEPGVELADLLSEKLGLLTNGTKRSEARRNKFAMIEVLKKHQLRTVEHIKSKEPEEIITWANERLTWPIVLKPLKSAGTENVFFCYSVNSIAKSFEKILGTQNVFGNNNTEVLAESYLDGAQYLVNMVSVNGKHILSDLWELVKKEITGASVVHDYQKLLPSTFYLKKDLVAYTRKVLDALEIRHGASHNEVFATKNGLTLVESGARIMGAIDPNLIAQSLGRSQLELTLASYIQPERFTELDMNDYKLKKHLWAKMLISNQSGIIKKIKFLDEIKSLPSFAGINFNVEVGKLVVKTVDLFTIPGIVFLCHENEKVVRNDYEKIAAIEQIMFEI